MQTQRILKVALGVLFVLVIVSLSIPASAQTAKDCYKAMLKVQTIMDNNIGGSFYEKAYTEASVEVAMYLKTAPASDVKTVVKEAWNRYELCHIGYRAKVIEQKNIDWARQQLEILGKLL